MPLSPGDPVRVATSKWGDRPHWEHEAVFLGSDDHGDWIGAPAGTAMSRPGLDLEAEVDVVMLVPAPGADRDRGWVATFHRPGSWAHTYVDMTTPPVWDDAVLRAVDLDLDVVRSAEGHVWIDDEDEFDDHRVRYGYPRPVVALARHSAVAVLDAVLDEREPFGDAPQPWFGVLDGLGRGRR